MLRVRAARANSRSPQGCNAGHARLHHRVIPLQGWRCESRCVNERCILCGHPRTAHFGTGCHTDSFLRGRCDCVFVELPPLPDSATPAQYRARAAWWQQRVEMAEARMRRTRMGSDRWWHLDRFIDAARSARARGLDLAAALEADPTPAIAAGPGDDLLDLVSIE